MPKLPFPARLGPLVLALVLLQAAVASGYAAAPHSQAETLRVLDARIPLPPPGAAVAAAYFTLRNTGDSPIVLTGIDCDIASGAMLHQSMQRHHEMLMRPVRKLELAPGQQASLAPGGMHVMLHGLQRPLRIGEQVGLTLHFADGSVRRIVADVRPLGSP